MASAFFLGIMVALTSSLLVLAGMVWRTPAPQ
jgi:hypothetical protein